jgi:hypothetical protein
MKKLISLVLASASTLAIAGCGATDTPSAKEYVLFDGTSNQTGLKGYWWTYIDRGTTSEVTPNTGKENPQDALSTKLKASIAVGNGIEVENGNSVLHVKGKVGPEPKYPPAEEYYDAYWDAFYSGICEGGKCGEYKYPSVGVGCGFKEKNRALGSTVTEGKYIGVGFKFKAGPDHAKTDDGTGLRPVAVSIPTDYTDAPDKSFNDEFGTQYNNANSVLYPSHGMENLPVCSFPTTPVPPDFKPIGSQSKTCFANMTTAASKNKPLAISSNWQTFCLKWEDFGPPTWATGLANVAFPQGGIKSLDPAHAIKLQFDADKPKTGEEARPFDFFIDDVELLTQEEWNTFCQGAKFIEPTTT